jgi:hypothetical protein
MRKSEKPKSERKRKSATPPIAPTARAADNTAALAPDDRVLASNQSLHELFAQQTARMLERAELTEEQKQSILIGMNCPCCGAGGFSFTAKLKRS